MAGFKKFFLSERNMMIIILLNAIVIFILYFPQHRNIEHGVSIFEWLDHLFIILYLIEAIVKMSVLKPKGYFSSGWNRFDFVIVMGSLPSFLIHFISIPNTSILIVLRLFRVVRLVRFLQFVPNLNQVVSGLGRALKASVFVLMALVFMNFLLAIFTCHFYGQLAPEYFGNPLIASFSIFQMFTVEGWNDIALIVANRTENTWLIGITRFYFVLVVLIGGVFGMSLANAVFVDEMTMDNNNALEAKIDRLQEQITMLQETLENREQSS